MGEAPGRGQFRVLSLGLAIVGLAFLMAITGQRHTAYCFSALINNLNGDIVNDFEDASE